MDNGFFHFYTTNSVPEITNKLEKLKEQTEFNNSPFVVLKLFGNTFEYNKKIIYVSSHNKQKLQAAWNWALANTINPAINEIIIKGINVDSDISPQTNQGSFNRLFNMKKYLKTNNIDYDYLFSFENRIMKNNNDGCCDFCCFSFQSLNSQMVEYENKYKSEGIVLIPEKYYNICLKLNQEKTIGEVIQDET